MAYILRIPFKIPPTRTFAVGTFSLEGLEMELSLQEPFYVLSVLGLATREDGVRLLGRLARALAWVGFRSSTGIEVSDDLQQFELLEEAVELAGFPGIWAHAIGDEGRPVLYLDDKLVRFAYVPPIGVKQDAPLSMFVERLGAGLQDHVDEALTNSKKQLAVDVLGSSYFETSPYAIFLTHVTVLEIMKEQRVHPKRVIDLISKWRTELRQLSEDGEIEAAVAKSIEGGLNRLREQSIGQAIQEVVTAVAGDEAGRKAKCSYGLRSVAVHRGTVDREEMRAQLGDLTDVVRLIVNHAVEGSQQG